MLFSLKSHNADGWIECYCTLEYPLMETIYTGFRLQFFKDNRTRLTIEHNGHVKVAYRADHEFDLFQHKEPELPIHYEEEVDVNDLMAYEYAKKRHQKLCQHLRTNYYQFDYTLDRE